MAQKKVMLTMPEAMFEALEREREKYIYNNIQELILDAVRDKYIRYRKSGVPSKRGRPKKTTSLDFLKRKKIFSEDGVAVDL